MKPANIPVLMLAQSLAMATAPVVILLGGIIGTELAPTPALATLPVSTMIVGTAVATVPAALLMGRFGRRVGFVNAALVAMCAALMAAFSIASHNFWLLILATFFLGTKLAFIQQYRFAAAESVTPENASKAIGWVLAGGIVAAYLGPAVAKATSDWLPYGLYTGSFVALAVILLLASVVLCFYRNVQVSTAVVEEPGRSLVDIFRQPVVLVALCSGVTAYAVMSFIMTATPLSMHLIDQHSMSDTTWVIQSHVLAMFIPSLFTGYLIAWVGLHRILLMGVLLNMGTVAFALSGHDLHSYWWALVLLGVGWNFLFLGATMLLTQTYLPQERFKVQAMNDFGIFTFQAIGSLSSGIVMHHFGWAAIQWVSLPFLILSLFAVLYFYRIQQKGAVIASAHI